MKRPHYPIVAVEEVANRLSGAKSFTSLDACSGYWQLPIDDESSELLTFNTLWERCRFTRLRFGISPAPEIYQRELDRLFEGVPVEIIVDQFLIRGKDQLEVDDKLRRVLDNSREVGLEKIRAINEIPPPEDKEGIVRILGAVNYLDKFIKHKAYKNPYCNLPKKMQHLFSKKHNKKPSTI